MVRPCRSEGPAVFRTLRKRNPSPYGFLMNLRGEDDSSVPWISGYDKGEYLVGASPEMFVRVERIEGKMRVETCPISGTIERGADALEDAVQVRTLLGSRRTSRSSRCARTSTGTTSPGSALLGL